MKTITIDKDKLDSIIDKLENERDEHSNISAEYIEIDNTIDTVLDIIENCSIE